MSGKNQFKAKISNATLRFENGLCCLPAKPKEAVSLPKHSPHTSEDCVREAFVHADSILEDGNDSEITMSNIQGIEWLPKSSAFKDASQDDNVNTKKKTDKKTEAKGKLRDTKKLKGESVKANTSLKSTTNSEGESKKTINPNNDINPELKAAERRARKREQVMLEKANDPILNWHLEREDTVYDPHAKATAMEKLRVANKARVFSSEHPFAVKVLTASSIYKCKKLVLPCTFSRGYMPKTDEILTWIDPCEKEWKCKWIGSPTYNRGHPFVSAGWPGFARAHQLIENDICIIEFIDRKEYRFRIHVFKQKLTRPQPE